MTHHCRLCGQPIEIPHLFSPWRQRTFEYIWQNPGCTREEIHDAIYNTIGRHVCLNIISVYIASIRRGLDDGHDYILTSTRHKPYQYYIKHAPILSSEGLPHHGIV
jgi:hypothetical protein